MPILVSPTTDTTADLKTSKADLSYVATELSLKAPKNSPAFTGDPTGPTPAKGDNDTSLANSAFVHNEIAMVLQVVAAYG